MITGTIRVLVIDDSSDDLYLISHYLSNITSIKLVVDTEINYENARQKILENRHDIYIVDYLLSSETGLQLIRECIDAGFKKPFIVLTGQGNKKIDIEAARTGAYDYLTKAEINSESLERSIRYSIERYAAYNIVAESEMRYREIFAKSNDIILVIDQDFCLINFNPVTVKLMGYSNEELTNKHISSLFEKQEESEKFINAIRESNNVNNLEIKLFTKSGLPKTFLVSCAKIITLNGNAQYQAILYDYTTIKKSYDEQLFREKIEAVHKLVRSLAHEIRNPLTNIYLALHQLETDIKEEGKIYSDIIFRNSKRINDLIGDLMNLSKPAKNDYHRIPVNEVLRAAIAEAMDRIRLKQIKISEKSLSEELFIWGDESKLQVAFLNIIINAIEAMENDIGELFIETTISDGFACIKISDNGTGIPTENLAQLFQPYFTSKKNGIGLGLATAHSVIQAHEGHIEVESVVGMGTTFAVKLRADLSNRPLKS